MGNKNKHKQENEIIQNDVDVLDTPQTSPVDANLEVEATSGLAQVLDENGEVSSPEIIEESQVTVEVAVPEIHTGVVNCERLNLRENPSTDCNAIEVLTKDTKVNVEVDDEVFGNFYKVTTENGTVGFCVKEYITIL